MILCGYERVDEEFFPQWSWSASRRSVIPYLFILVEEILSRLLKHNFATRKTIPFSHPMVLPLSPTYFMLMILCSLLMEKDLLFKLLELFLLYMKTSLVRW